MPEYKKKWWIDAQQFDAKPISIAAARQMLTLCKDQQERIFLILLYYTGARPAEIIKLKRENIFIDGGLFVVQMKTKKHGIGRQLSLPINDLTSEVISYANTLPNDAVLLPRFHNTFQTRNLIYRLSGGTLTQYFFRHSRMTKLAMKGATVQELKYFKGAKDTRSVDAYVHIGGQEIKKLAEMID